MHRKLMSAAAVRRERRKRKREEDDRSLSFGRLSRLDDYDTNITDQHARNAEVRERDGRTLVAELSEEDESAFLEGARHVFRELCRLLRIGAARHVEVTRVDRLSRNPRTFAPVVDEWADLAVVVHVSSTGDVYDLSRPDDAERLLEKVKEGHAYSMAISIGVEAAQARKRAAGVAHGSVPPFGWLDTMCRVHDEEQVALIVEAIERVLAGVSLTRIADDWTVAGVLTPSERYWNKRSVQSLLDCADALTPEYVQLRVEALQRVEAGERPSVIARDWNFGGRRVPFPQPFVQGAGWNGSQVKRIISACRVAGLVWDLDAETFVQGDPDHVSPIKRGIRPIISRERWEELLRYLAARQEFTVSFDRPRGAMDGKTAWDSGIVECTQIVPATFQSGPRAGQPRPRAGKRCKGRLYKTCRGTLQCGRCRRTSVARERFSAALAEAIIHAVEHDGLLEAVQLELSGAPAELRQLRTAISIADVELGSIQLKIREEREAAAEQDRRPHIAALLDAARDAQKARDMAQERYAELVALQGRIDPTLRDEFRATWEEADDAWRRQLIRHITKRIECLPSRDESGEMRRIEDRLRITWRGADSQSSERAA